MLKKIKYKIESDRPFINIEGLSKVYNPICIFDSNKTQDSNLPIAFSKLIAIGSSSNFIVENNPIRFKEFDNFFTDNKQWKFGYLSYDLKNSIENLDSQNDDFLKFPLLHFFIPKYVFEINNTNVYAYYDDKHSSPEDVEIALKLALSEPTNAEKEKAEITLKNKITKDEYIDAITLLKENIQKGNIYEINYCQEFYSQNTIINPYRLYTELNVLSKAPFASFCKFDNHFIISSSPERFLKKVGSKLISQPIKGTIKRSKDIEKDRQLKDELKNNPKEQNENVMIVDLVRNDLSKIAEKGSVQVDELFGVYSFEQVHQLISTVSCVLKQNVSFSTIIKSLFPMGSMTGAPKISAMQLIEKTEKTKRGVYSGCLGYIHPNGDFDFNVVIRTILYDATQKYLSFMVGSAITAKADANKEYEECLLKAKALIEAIEKN